MSKSSARQFLVKVAGIDGYFTSKSGGESAAGTTKVYDGGKMVPSIISGPTEIGDVTCGHNYDPLVDGPLLKKLRTQVGEWITTVSITPTDRNLVPVGPPVVYSDALLASMTEPDADAESGDKSGFELTFTVSYVS